MGQGRQPGKCMQALPIVTMQVVVISTVAKMKTRTALYP